MPVHRVALDDLETEFAKIEKTERVIATEWSVDGAILIFTEAKQNRAPGVKETR